MNAEAYADFLDRLDRRTIVVTAGQRLARYLVWAYGVRRVAAGARAWEQPQILSWEAWLVSLWQAYTQSDKTSAVLLSEEAERALWMRLIEEEDDSTNLLAPEAAARTAQEAWRLVHAWRLSFDEIARVEASDDVYRFCGWAARYRARSDEFGVLDAARLPDVLADAIAAGRIEIAFRRLWLAGFEELDPQQRAFIDRLRAAGVEVDALPPPHLRQVRALRLEFRNEQDETAALARWVRNRLEANPEARIGIVVPEFGRRRAALVRALEDALAPARVLPGGFGTALSFNVSLGLPLAGYPLVETALDIIASSLMLKRDRRLKLEAASALLRSPFVAGALAEAAARARCDAVLREAREPWVSLEQLLRAAEQQGCVVFAARLRAWRETLEHWPASKQALSCWIADFMAALHALGWPAVGDRPLASEEYQTFEAWRGLIRRLGALERILPAAIEGEALRRHLEHAARNVIFQPQSAEVPVQVLGLFEAEGMVFDHLWVTDLNDEVWPRPPEPNPLLPVRLQRDRRMPRASPERELEFAERLTTRWLAAAPEVVLSYGVSEQDRVRHASPLIVKVPIAADPERILGAPYVPYRRRIFEAAQAARAIEQCDDWQGPPLADVADRTAYVHGGTWLVADQSACSFRAFARYRLGSCPLTPVAFSLTAAERGQLVHEALRVAWEYLRDKVKLDRLDEADLRKLAARAANTALDKLRRQRPFTLAGRYGALERERIATLVCNWLRFERKRPEGFVVHALEACWRLEVGGLRLDARLDRVDRLDSGGYLVLDYKTGGDCRVQHWFGERPRDPQLTLYALYALDPNEVAGIAYALVRRGRLELRGLARSTVEGFGQLEPFSESEFAKKYASWTQMLEGVRAVLERLASEFRQGLAWPEPRARIDCGRCEQQPLCRLVELDERRGVFAPGGKDEQQEEAFDDE